MRAYLRLPAILLAAWPWSTPKPATICIASTVVEATPGNAADAAEAVRAAFAEYLTGPRLNHTALKSKLTSQAREEARAANCPYLLLTTIKHVRKSRSGGSLTGRLAGGALQGGSYAAGSAISSAVGGEAGRILGGAASGAASAAATSTYARSVSAMDELTLGTKLEASDGKVLVDRTDKHKAQSDGEDLLSVLIRKAAEEVASVVTKQ